MSFGQTIVVGLITAFVAALLTWAGHVLVASLQRRNEQARYFRERLLERYSEFVALASADLERAKALEAHLALRGLGCDKGVVGMLFEKRQALHFDLLRVSLQIRLFESDTCLTKTVEELANTQPWLPPNWGQQEYNDQFEKYRMDIAAFEKLMTEFVDKVLKKHSTKVGNTVA